MNRFMYAAATAVTRTLACAAIALSPYAFATPTFTVNSMLDGVDDDVSDGVCHTAANTCTLRAAIMQANRAGGLGATIVLPAGTYVLTRPPSGTDGEDSGDLNLTTPAGGAPLITISGAGASTTIIDANQIDRVLTVEASATALISGVTIRGGYTISNDGGGILNSGTLTLDRVAITQNHAANLGGGINNRYTLTVRDSSVVANTSQLGAGGLFNEGTAALIRSTFSLNTAYLGGGIYNYRSMTIVDSTVAGNEALTDGGGIYAVENHDAATNIYSSTIAYNDADRDRQGAGYGGGIHIDTYLGGAFNIRNTLITGNTVGNTPIYDDCAVSNGAYVNSWGVNLIGTSAGCLISTVAGTWNYFSGSLGGLQNNGGPTDTIALLSGGYNNAIDGGDPAQGCVDDAGATLATDQRGFARTIGSACDIGAFEFDSDRIFLNGFD